MPKVDNANSPQTENSLQEIQNGDVAALTEAETQLLNTPDAELTAEQRAEKQGIIERQQAANNPSAVTVGTICVFNKK